MTRVLITCPYLQETIDRYRPLFAARRIEIALPPVEQRMRAGGLLNIIGEFDGIIAGDDELTAAVLERAVRLRVISRWGVGIDAIDLAAAAHRGIQVFNTPGVFADEVADIAMGYLILLARRLHVIDRLVRAGEWAKIRGVSLAGKTLGIIGVGSIGRALARRAAAAGITLLGTDIVPPPPEVLPATGLRLVALDELLRESDFVSLNCVLTPATRHLLGRAQFGMLKRGAYIVNTSRGALIDEEALVRALREGRIAGAALDVFEEEPLSPDSPLRAFEQCILGSHNSSNTHEAVLRTNELAIENLLKGLGS
jgi:D-3-phosphoglycerate dehydrogenase